jgi:hypothetical protein
MLTVEVQLHGNAARKAFWVRVLTSRQYRLASAQPPRRRGQSKGDVTFWIGIIPLFLRSSMSTVLLQSSPPSLADMLSFTTLTPHYEEDVVYALNATNVAKKFGLDSSVAKAS